MNIYSKIEKNLIEMKINVNNLILISYNVFLNSYLEIKKMKCVHDTEHPREKLASCLGSATQP